MKKNKIETYLNKIYVDDHNLMMRAIESGTRWTGDAIEWSEEWRAEDEEKGEGSDKRSMREIRKMSNTILPYIVMEETVASDCKDRKLPILDLKIWLEKRQEEQKIMFEYYRKPMASRLLMLASTQR